MRILRSGGICYSSGCWMVLDEVGTLLDLSRHWAKVCPDDIVYTFLSDGESDEENITYAELDRRARAIASELQNLGAQGQRVLLLYPSGLDNKVLWT